MKAITRWMVKRFLPGFQLVEIPIQDIHFRAFMAELYPNYHLAKNPPKGRRVKKEEAQQ